MSSTPCLDCFLNSPILTEYMNIISQKSVKKSKVCGFWVKLGLMLEKANKLALSMEI